MLCLLTVDGSRYIVTSFALLESLKRLPCDDSLGNHGLWRISRLCLAVIASLSCLRVYEEMREVEARAHHGAKSLASPTVLRTSYMEEQIFLR